MAGDGIGRLIRTSAFLGLAAFCAAPQGALAAKKWRDGRDSATKRIVYGPERPSAGSPAVVDMANRQERAPMGFLVHGPGGPRRVWIGGRRFRGAAVDLADQRTIKDPVPLPVTLEGSGPVLMIPWARKDDRIQVSVSRRKPDEGSAAEGAEETPNAQETLTITRRKGGKELTVTSSGGDVDRSLLTFLGVVPRRPDQHRELIVALGERLVADMKDGHIPNPQIRVVRGRRGGESAGRPELSTSVELQAQDPQDTDMRRPGSARFDSLLLEPPEELANRLPGDG